MAELKLLIASRKYLRKQVTENYNKRSEFSGFSMNERNKYRSVFEDHLERLKELNSKIQTIKWSEDLDEARLEEGEIYLTS